MRCLLKCFVNVDSCSIECKPVKRCQLDAKRQARIVRKFLVALQIPVLLFCLNEMLLAIVFFRCNWEREGHHFMSGVHHSIFSFFLAGKQQRFLHTSDGSAAVKHKYEVNTSLLVLSTGFSLSAFMWAITLVINLLALFCKTGSSKKDGTPFHIVHCHSGSLSRRSPMRSSKVADKRRLLVRTWPNVTLTE